MIVAIARSGKARRAGILRLPAPLKTVSVANAGGHITLSRAELAELISKLGKDLEWTNGAIQILDPAESLDISPAQASRLKKEIVDV